jgi:hypothetical protein
LLFLLKVIFGIKICVLKKYSLLFKQILWNQLFISLLSICKQLQL